MRPIKSRQFEMATNKELLMLKRSGVFLLFLTLSLLSLPVVSFAQGVSFSVATNFPVGSSPVSVAVRVFNGDGRLDLAIMNYLSADVSILLGNGDWTFKAARNFAVGNAASVALGDFNGDANLDLAVADVLSKNVSILLGNGD